MSQPVPRRFKEAIELAVHLRDRGEKVDRIAKECWDGLNQYGVADDVMPELADDQIEKMAILLGNLQEEVRVDKEWWDDVMTRTEKDRWLAVARQAALWGARLPD